MLLQLIPIVWSHDISWHSWAVFVNLKCWQRVLSYQQFSMSGFWWKECTSSVLLTINKRILYNTLGLWMQPSHLLCHFLIKVIDICGIEISYDYIKITVWPKEKFHNFLVVLLSKVVFHLSSLGWRSNIVSPPLVVLLSKDVIHFSSWGRKAETLYLNPLPPPPPPLPIFVFPLLSLILASPRSWNIVYVLLRLLFSTEHTKDSHKKMCQFQELL